MPSREQLWEMLESNGAKCKDYVTKSTDLLLIGEGYGNNKILAARRWGKPTVSLPMWEYLGLFERRGDLAIDPQLADILPSILTTHVFICEMLYGHFIRTSRSGGKDSRIILGSFYLLAAGLDELLRIAWGGSGDRNGEETSPGLDDLLRSFASLRSEIS